MQPTMLKSRKKIMSLATRATARGCAYAAIVALTALGTAGAASAQAKKAAKPAVAPPNISGLWIKPWGLSKLPEGVEKAVVNPPDIQPPDYTPEYRAKHEAIKATQLAAGTAKGAGAAAADSVAVRRQSSCLPYGMPRMMNWQQSLDIMQAPDRITINGEIDREVRRIWLDREQLPLEEVDLGWFGRSVGKWQGQKLVVNTIGIKETVDGENYMAHSEAMVITEHIYLQQHDVLYVDFTITDPVALKKPLTYRAIWVRAPKDFEPTEYVCDNLRSRVTKDGKILHDFEETAKDKE